MKFIYFQNANPVNLDLCKVIITGNDSTWFTIKFVMVDKDIVIWSFDNQELRDNTYNKIISKYSETL